MKEIYIKKVTFGNGYEPTTMDDIQRLVDDGALIMHAKIEFSVNDEIETCVHIFEELFFRIFGVDAEYEFNRMVDDYVNYIESITGFAVPINELKISKSF